MDERVYPAEYDSSTDSPVLVVLEQEKVQGTGETGDDDVGI
jgi:hypothetical protein